MWQAYEPGVGVISQAHWDPGRFFCIRHGTQDGVYDARLIEAYFYLYSVNSEMWGCVCVSYRSLPSVVLPELDVLCSN